MLRMLAYLKMYLGSEKILFGSDWPLGKQFMGHGEWVEYVRELRTPQVLLDQGYPDFSMNEKQKILGDNVAKILNL